MPNQDASGDRTDPFLTPPEAVVTEETLTENHASLVRVARDGETQLRWTWKGKVPPHIKKLLGALPDILPECEDLLLDGSGYTARDFHFTLEDASQHITPAGVLPLIAQALEYDTQFAKCAQVSLKAFDPTRVYICNNNPMRLPALDDLRLCFYHLEDLAPGAGEFTFTAGLAAWLHIALSKQPGAQAFSDSLAAIMDFLNALIASPADFAGIVPSLRLAVEWAAKTHPGLVRENNEDAFLALTCQLEGSSDSSSLFAVADGMGGHNAGEIASSLCLDLLRFYSGLWPLSRGGSRQALVRLISEHLRALSKELHESSLSDTEFAGMGTTLTGVYFTHRGALCSLFPLVTLAAHVFNVGDSRAFAADERGVSPLTRDHSLVQELIDAGNLSEEMAYTHPQRNVISQGMGITADIKPDVSLFRLPLDSYTVLCSDGLSDLVRPQRIAELAGEAATPEALVDALIKEALELGGKDNITVIVLKPRVTFGHRPPRVPVEEGK